MLCFCLISDVHVNKLNELILKVKNSIALSEQKPVNHRHKHASTFFLCHFFSNSFSKNIRIFILISSFILNATGHKSAFVQCKCHFQYVLDLLYKFRLVYSRFLRGDLRRQSVRNGINHFPIPLLTFATKLIR